MQGRSRMAVWNVNDCLEIYGKVFAYVQEKSDDVSKEEGDGEQSVESVTLRLAGEYNTGKELLHELQVRSTYELRSAI